jgi:anaerobic selenocysteine-containing dehydrogenase
MNEAFASLDAMVSIDIYLNETTRHADVVLPPASALEKSHFDIAFSNLSVRNVANYSAPVFDSEQPAEDDIIARLALLAMGMEGDATLVHDQLVNQLLSAEVGASGSPVEGRNVEDLIAMVDGDTGSDRMLDAMLRTGPHGDAFGANPDGLSLQKLRDNPHGIDLGALEPRLPAALQTPEKRIDLFAGPFLEELTRLEARVVEWASDGRLRLIGRRHLRSNNSWMHNVEVLVKGKARCTLQINPDDAAELGVVDGGKASVRSRVGEVTADVEVTDIVMPGVVSLPHGWGHGQPGAQLDVAARHAGVNSNVLTDPLAIDPVSGTSVLNGIPVEVAPA